MVGHSEQLVLSDCGQWALARLCSQVFCCLRAASAPGGVANLSVLKDLTKIGRCHWHGLRCTGSTACRSDLDCSVSENDDTEASKPRILRTRTTKRLSASDPTSVAWDVVKHVRANESQLTQSSMPREDRSLMPCCRARTGICVDFLPLTPLDSQGAQFDEGPLDRPHLFIGCPPSKSGRMKSPTPDQLSTQSVENQLEDEELPNLIDPLHGFNRAATMKPRGRSRSPAGP